MNKANFFVYEIKKKNLIEFEKYKNNWFKVWKLLAILINFFKK